MSINVIIRRFLAGTVCKRLSNFACSSVSRIPREGVQVTQAAVLLLSALPFWNSDRGSKPF